VRTVRGNGRSLFTGFSGHRARVQGAE
jgi:hypothetical protein